MALRSLEECPKGGELARRVCRLFLERLLSFASSSERPAARRTRCSESEKKFGKSLKFSIDGAFVCCEAVPTRLSIAVLINIPVFR